MATRVASDEARIEGLYYLLMLRDSFVSGDIFEPILNLGPRLLARL